MTAASVMFGPVLEDVFDVTNLAINLDGDAFKIALATATYTPDPNAHSTYSDLTNECPATGNYAAGGTALVSPTWATGSGIVKFSSNDPAWANLTAVNIRQGFIYDTTTSNKALTNTDLTADYNVTAGTLTWQVAANGHYYFDITP